VARAAGQVEVAKAARTRARVQRRRRQILDAATELMSKNGFHAMSMQSVADRGGISVGLIYQYFGNKDDLLVAVIQDILEDFRDQVPQAIEVAARSSDGDPVARFKAAFDACCRIVAAKRDAVTLTYRESATLPAEGLARIKQLELQIGEPIREVFRDGVRAGVFTGADERLVVQNLLLAAHAWALKYWNLGQFLTVDEYVDQQFELLLGAVRVP